MNEKVKANSALSLGIEEEFHLVDLRTRQLTPRANEVLARLEGATHDYTSELQQTVVETNSAVVTTLSELRENLLAVRGQLVRVAETLGIGVASAGTMPLSMAEVMITESPRFRRMLAEYQLLVREQLICGMQVHVGVADRDSAARLLHRVAPWLPPLLALSASSPFSHSGEDTGYASSRSLIWSRWPTTGCPGPLGSAAEYEALVRNLVASGVISDSGMIYFEVRPSAHVPTIELRICDACHLVDTVVLVAGLFRAVVARELSKLMRGEPPHALPPPMQRASMWRAARSGLEGELVDVFNPGGYRSVPAAVVVRNMVTELRPELEAADDWKAVLELSEMALAAQSGAARQREALRRRQSFKDVVDLIVAETKGERLLPAGMAASLPVTRGYRAPGFDEAVFPDGRARPAHAAVLQALSELGPSGMRERQAELERATAAAGVLFRPADAKAASAFPIDLVPRILTGEEWSRVQGGTAQRARALDAFLNDVYGEASIVRDGVVPAWLVEAAPGRRAAGTAPPKGARRAHVCGFDVVRDADGRWLVLEDNVRVPSGVGYAIEARRLSKSVLPELASETALLNPEAAPALLRRTLEQSAPPRTSGSSPIIAVLGDGPHDSAYFEHRLLAGMMDVPLCVPSDLLVQEDMLYYSAANVRTRVDVVYLRMDDSLGRRKGADGKLLGPELLRAVRAGTLTLANALGNGVADDKAIYDYVPKFIEYYLGEIPLLEQVPTYHCADPDQKQLVLSRLDQLVVKPVDGYGGLGVVIGPLASDRELAEVERLVRDDPGRWIAQETVTLSTHPTHFQGRLEPRHVDLRVFVYYGEEPVVVPAALTRVAGRGSMVVNSSRGGGAKDTWLLQ